MERKPWGQHLPDAHSFLYTSTLTTDQRPMHRRRVLVNCGLPGKAHAAGRPLPIRPQPPPQRLSHGLVFVLPGAPDPDRGVAAQGEGVRAPLAHHCEAVGSEGRRKDTQLYYSSTNGPERDKIHTSSIVEVEPYRRIVRAAR